MEITRGFVKTSLGHIHYRAAGAGKAVMLFHITQQSSAMMLELIEALCPNLRVVAIDLPSHGCSDHFAGELSIPDYGRCAIEVMDGLAIANSHVLGEAVGAIIATEMAGTYPERVEKAVVVNTPFVSTGTTKDTGAKVTDLQRPTDSSGFPVTRTIDYVLEHDLVHAPMRPTQSWMDRLNIAHMEAGRDRWQGMNAMHAYDFPANVTRVRCPILLIYGEHFYFTPRRSDFMSRLKDAQVDVLDDARFCVTWERAKDVAARSWRFFESG
jgi:pimeloyl-ACP methyl ester carboxylesterase